MTPEQWQRVKGVVANALETPPSEREKLVQAECGGDAELCAEVQSLLSAAEAADSLPEARSAMASAGAALAAEQDATLRSLLESVLSHQYEFIRPLGRGGMGSVYLARERALERFVAIKVLRPDLAMAEGHRERFRREARTVARLSHPGILGLHSFGEIDNLWYFVMTYVRGETLAERIRREGALPWAEAHGILSEMADALDCAHRNGVVHRDIKPANILLDSESGHAILADFGISKMLGMADSLTATGAVVGTPDYMSPEQVSGASDVDERSDIYALGAVAYIMLTGQEPFRADTPGGALYKRLVEDPAPINMLAPSVPPDLAAVVLKCMARDRANRWPTARAVKDALGSILAIERLPDMVRDLPGFGPYAILWGGAWSAFALLARRPPHERALLLLVALIVPLGLILHLWNGAGRGMRFSDLARIALWPPEWWGMWWPRALRRPSDLWDRLPFAARAVRVLITFACPALLGIVLLRGEMSADGDVLGAAWIERAEWVVFIAGLIAVGAGFVWARRKGIAFERSPRLLLGPTIASSGWTDPELSRLLVPVSGKIRPPDREAPADYLRAIRELLPMLHLDRNEVTLRTTSVAEALLKAIDAHDRELASLARDAGQNESARLASKLDALDSSPGGETSERGELRTLLRYQLDVVRRMQTRSEIVRRERRHLLDLLRGLWTIVQAASDNPDSSSGIARLEALCEEIRVEIEPPPVLGPNGVGQFTRPRPPSR